MFKVQEVTFQNDHHNFAYEHFSQLFFDAMTHLRHVLAIIRGEIFIKMKET